MLPKDGGRKEGEGEDVERWWTTEEHGGLPCTPRPNTHKIRILGKEDILDQFRRTRYYEKPFQTRRRINFEKCKAIYNEDMDRKIQYVLHLLQVVPEVLMQIPPASLCHVFQSFTKTPSILSWLFQQLLTYNYTNKDIYYN
uniref:Uncharacterized protein n=1 Tax=Timema poppense TaxID=170557 RepID=A0A7R9DEM0_TIMPO|nr:unnamed protein product [Timema poppensis]